MRVEVQRGIVPRPAHHLSPRQGYAVPVLVGELQKRQPPLFKEVQAHLSHQDSYQGKTSQMYRCVLFFFVSSNLCPGKPWWFGVKLV